MAMQVSPAVLDEYLERTVRFEGVSMLPDACGRTAQATPRALGRGDAQLFTARRLRRRVGGAATTTVLDTAEEDAAIRRAVIGIWSIAALLFATLALLVK